MRGIIEAARARIFALGVFSVGIRPDWPKLHTAVPFIENEVIGKSHFMHLGSRIAVLNRGTIQNSSDIGLREPDGCWINVRSAPPTIHDDDVVGLSDSAIVRNWIKLGLADLDD